MNPSIKSAAIFTGQGFDFEEIQAIPKTSVSIVGDAFYEIFGYKLKSLDELSGSELKQNEVSCAVLLCSALSTLDRIHHKTDMCAGYSVGQYLAMYYAEMLDKESLVRLVFKRCKLMNKVASRKDGAMAAILGLPLAKVLEICESHQSGVLSISNDNAPGNVTISGSRELVETAMGQAKAAGAPQVRMLETSGAWHCDMMTDIQSEFLEALSEFSIGESRIDVIDNVEISSLSVENLAKALSDHLAKKVRWRETIKYFVSQNVSECVELTHFSLLSKMGPFISRKVKFTRFQATV